ncbi:MAG: guanine nucleotide exchange protein for ADP-robosylation factor [Sclerophora amabilis]|nr:MAG: guanine nucleotide exchange protein for ADP-robosylation factor [Sclerophora amabilis]
MAETDSSVPDTQDGIEDRSQDDQPAESPTSPTRVQGDKEALKTGQDWMEIRMEDAKSEIGESPDNEGGATSPSRSLQQPDDPDPESHDTEKLPSEGREDTVPGYPTVSVRGPSESLDEEPPTPPPKDWETTGGTSAANPQDRPLRSNSIASSVAASEVPTRLRTDPQASAAAGSAPRTSNSSSVLFVISALETINSSKEARKKKELKESVQNALVAIKRSGDAELPDPEIIFEPLQMATMTNSIPLTTAALDCIGKLMSYSYFSIPADPQPTKSSETLTPLVERAIDTIIECFQGEATPAETQLQIVKSLLAAILNDKIVVHGAGLLKAVRQTYNIFLLSKSSANQQVAQGTLAQMVGTVFERVKTRIAMKEARMRSSKPGTETEIENEAELISDPNSAEAMQEDQSDDIDRSPSNLAATESESSGLQGPKEKITLQSFENRKSFDDERIHDNAPTTVTKTSAKDKLSRIGSSPVVPSLSTHIEENVLREEEEDEIYVKDAFLVFRAMCKLSIKTLPTDQLLDLKSHGMRSKLLSLHLIHTIVNNNTIVFTSPLATIRSSSSNEPTNFVQAIKQYLCLSLSRNGSSSVNRVFEVGCEIFWLMLKNMRGMLKKEIEVFLKEIYLAILDKKNAPATQKQYLMSVFERLCADPRALVEIYLNYDCDRMALDNVFQRLATFPIVTRKHFLILIDRIIEHLSRISSSPIAVSVAQEQQYQVQQLKNSALSSPEWQGRGTMPPSLSTVNINSGSESEPTVPIEYSLKLEALECLVRTLDSLVNWSQQGIADASARIQEPESRNSVEDYRESLEASNLTPNTSTPKISSSETPPRIATPLPHADDDPSELEKAKQRKTALFNGVKQFNFKPKRGIKYLLNEGFIPSDSSDDIARFLHQESRLDKAALGEYLGEGETENIATMHAFVDLMDFTKMRFVDSLRRFLQSFRLPGEAQKIDRFMLKFAERYITGNPNAFANADTAYVLAYSVIMLNTDQHSSKMKGRRMTKEDFIKNNRGINDSADLPDAYLEGIFDEIAHNEIVLDTERDAAAALGLATQPAGGIAANIGQALATVGRDLQREAYVQASEEMANKTEQSFRSLLRTQRKNASKAPPSRYIPATSFRHVGPMFEVTWMSFLSGLSGQVHNTQNAEIIKLCMEGFKLAIRISCLFDLETPRVAFVSALAKSTNLNNLSEMVSKNVEALKLLLEVAQTEGNLLKSSWRDVLTCISQLDRFQLISTGVDEGVVPDVSKANIVPPSRADSASSRRSMQANRRPRPRTGGSSTNYLADVAQESRSTEVVRGVDRIFTSTANLSGDAIVHFVKALSDVSWQEIQSSGQSDSPRTFSLQKLVEISYYNMTRVRFEWSAIWQVLGVHFNQVGCHTNTNVVFFALDSLRQLSMRFMEIEELPGFKFQKDFLKPFEHVIANTGVVPVKDMILRCLIQMIQAQGSNIRSGWRTMFSVFTVAAREPYEGVVQLALDHVTQIYDHRFGLVISQEGAFADLVVCLTEFSKNMRFQKKSLQAIEMMKSTMPKMLRTPECSLSQKSSNGTDNGKPLHTTSQRNSTRSMQEEQFWFPVLFGFHTVLMTGDDLEVRSRALNYLFEGLIKYGGDFSLDFWDILWRQLLYPIFMVLKSKSEMSKVLNHEELSVWLSTTMIQALRNMIALFTHYFESLEYMLDRFLDLLTLCICQENDTIARIGSNCLQQLILQNVNKFRMEHWTKIVGAFVELFERTTAYQLFSAATTSSGSAYQSNGGPTSPTPAGDRMMADLPLSSTSAEDGSSSPSFENSLKINGLPPQSPSSVVVPNDELTGAPPESENLTPTETNPASELEDYRPQAEHQQQPVVVTAARRRFFNKIITKCVLQLLMIETVNELFSNDAVYAQIPSLELLRLMGLLKKSYQFAKKFNGDKDLRMRLWREGFMKQPPNLLKQESGSAATYIAILLRMYHDNGEERRKSRAETEAALIPLCADIIHGYTVLDEETQQRNIVAWRPVVVDVLEGYLNFPEEGFEKYIETFYPLTVDILGRDVGMEIRLVLQALLRRFGEVKMGMMPVAVHTSPTTASAPFPSLKSRRASRGR